MRALLIWAALIASSGACGASGPKPRTIVMTTVAVAAVPGEAALAYAIHQPAASAIAFEVGGGTIAGLLPATLLDHLLHDRPDSPPSTPGEIYADMLRGLGGAALTSLSCLAPSFATWGVAEWREGAPESRGWGFNGALAGSAAGLLLGGLLFHDDDVPRWARIAISSALIGAGATLGYQIGSGGPR